MQLAPVLIWQSPAVAQVPALVYPVESALQISRLAPVPAQRCWPALHVGGVQMPVLAFCAQSTALAHVSINAEDTPVLQHCRSCEPRQKKALGVQPTTPQTWATPVPPQVWPLGQAPQSICASQPSPMRPQ
jgi:hypothetical protein